MGPIGFSTGALALSDFHRALALQDRPEIGAVELSALREQEVPDLVEAIPTLDLERFNYVSFHAPSKLRDLSETDLIRQLLLIRSHVAAVIVHPDIITDFAPWRELGDWVLLENMDQRKRVCRNAREMAHYFANLPEARFCFDIGHARQVDPTMSVAVDLLTRYADRLAELHISEVNPECRHVPLSFNAVHAYQRVATLLPPHLPVIIESMVTPAQIDRELEMTFRCFASARDRELLAF